VWTQWKKALEGWNVRVSQQVLEWQAEGKAEAKVETRRADLLCALETLCGPETPAEVATLIAASADPEQLSRWLDAALKVRSYDEFRAAISS